MKLFKKIIWFVLGLGLGHVWGSSTNIKKSSKNEMHYKELSDKHLSIMLLMNQWLIVKQKGKTVAAYLEKHNVKKIAIYGFGYLGNRLYDELVDSGIEITCIIDQKADMFSTDVEVYSPQEKLPEVDLIVVTSPYYYDAIEKQLLEVTTANIISLEDILYEI